MAGYQIAFKKRRLCAAKVVWSDYHMREPLECHMLSNSENILEAPEL